MSIENFNEIQKEIDDERKEGTLEDEGFFAALDIINENPSNPHFSNVDVNVLTPEDLVIALKFQNNELTEKEVNDRLEHLPDGSPSSNFLSALRNKLVERNGWEMRMKRKRLQENQQSDTV